MCHRENGLTQGHWHAAPDLKQCEGNYDREVHTGSTMRVQDRDNLDIRPKDQGGDIFRGELGGHNQRKAMRPRGNGLMCVTR